MDDIALGRALRAVRVHRGLRQTDVSDASGVCRTLVSSAECGQLDMLRLRDIRAIAGALQVRIALQPSFRGGDLDRLVNVRHNAMHERMALAFERSGGWVATAEATFSRFGERGSIDILAWHEPSRSLLICELKTELIDPAGLIAQLDRYRRVAAGLARERGWLPASLSCWVVIADTDMNRRALAAHRTLLRRAFPVDGRAMRKWLGSPVGAVSALSFLANAAPHDANDRFGPTKRVRRHGAATTARISAGLSVPEHVGAGCRVRTRTVDVAAPARPRYGHRGRR